MKNIVLIGMPGCGKSTVGVVLAKKLGYRFIDSDLLIQEKYDKTLEELIEEHGDAGFIQIENDVNAAIDADKTIIATGGSVVYGDAAMTHLKSIGTVIYLEVSEEELENRLGSLKERGVVSNGKTTVKEIFEDRKRLYRKYADITFRQDGEMLRETVEQLYAVLKDSAAV
ncbi:MAG: shikimate kinase [Lachnospira sp.]|nr:shikimate kinase [Lachnospira sp.]